MTHSQSDYLDEVDGVIAKAEFQDFAPSSCVCCGCLVPEAQKKRLFLYAYKNKLMMNQPCAPCCCFCDDEMYMADQASVMFYDKPPMRSGMCCICCPFTCCGPPVIYAYIPKCCCCIDLSSCCGQQLMAAPCNCYGCKILLCCGNPCYTTCSYPLITGLSNTPAFLAKLKASTAVYHEAKNIPESQRVIFESVSDDVGVFGGVKQVDNIEMKRA